MEGFEYSVVREVIIFARDIGMYRIHSYAINMKPILAMPQKKSTKDSFIYSQSILGLFVRKVRLCFGKRVLVASPISALFRDRKESTPSGLDQLYQVSTIEDRNRAHEEGMGNRPI